MGIGNCSYSSGTPARIALAILGVQSAGFALFYGIGNCSYSSGTPARIALAILEVQSAGFALFYDLLYKLRVNGTKMRCGRRECKGFRRESAR